MTFEQCINRIVFGIPSLPKPKFDYLKEYVPYVFKKNEWKQLEVLEVDMFPDPPE